MGYKLTVLISLIALLHFQVYAQPSQTTEEKHSVVVHNSNQDTASNAWYLGLQGGATKSMLLTNINNRPYEAYRPGYGCVITSPVTYVWRLGKSRVSELGISSEIFFIQKSYNLVGIGYYNNSVQLNQHTRNDYLQVPITANYDYNFGNLKLLVCGGMYGGYWFEGHIKGSYQTQFNTSLFSQQYSYNEQYTFNKRRDERWEYGWHIGSGVSYEIGKKKLFLPFIRFDFYQALSDQRKTKHMAGQIPQYNQTYALSAGILIRINHDKKKFKQ